MCGIAGVFNYARKTAVLPETIEAMCDAMRYRGPDARGSLLRTAEGLGLGHVRLSIIDLAGGDQPIANEDGSIWTIFNGEIYNYPELRAGLEHRGHVFRTRTDTEVLVHLYEEKGARLVDDLIGDFAFAIWDDNERCLTLARDRLGVKPLFYSHHDGQLAFASTLPALLAGSSAPREIDPLSMYCYLAYGCIQAPLSIYRDMRKLPPGHLLSIRGGAVRIEKYWDFQLVPDETRSLDSWADELSTLVDDAVRRQMMADVPIGAFLSGGVDSSAIVRHMADHAEGRVKTFSIGYRETHYDESRYFKLLAGELGIEHHELVFEPDLLRDVTSIAERFGEPCATASAFPLFHLAKLAREHVKVVLSGDGPDEIFAGYELDYRYTYLLERARQLAPRSVWHLAFLMTVPTRVLSVESRVGNFFRRLRKFLGTASLIRPMWQPFLRTNRTLRTRPERLLHDRILMSLEGELPYVSAFRRYQDAKDWMRGVLYADIKCNLPDEMFTKLDCMGMANSLEGRVPLCDHRIVELAARIPSRMKYDGRRGKVVFRKAVAASLPKAIQERAKVGFRVPLNEWFRGELAGLAHEMLTDRSFRESELFAPPVVQHILDVHAAQRDNFGRIIWSLMIFELWRRSVGATRATAIAQASRPIEVMTPA